MNADDRVRELLRGMADDVPAYRDVPSNLEARARRRIAVTVGASTLGTVAVVLVAVLTFGSLRATTGPEPATSPTPSPSIAIPTTSATLTLSRTGCAYDGAETAPAGEIAVAVVNTTRVDATPKVFYSALLQISERHTVGDLERWITGPRADAPPSWVTTVDEGETFPGEDDELNATITNGTWALVCATPHEKNGKIWVGGSFRVPR
jgi:hypothetical protein